MVYFRGIISKFPAGHTLFRDKTPIYQTVGLLLWRLQRPSLPPGGGLGLKKDGWGMATDNDDVLVTYCRYSVYKDALPVAAAGLTFLSLNKKVSKEVSPGEALTAKPFGTASVA